MSPLPDTLVHQQTMPHPQITCKSRDSFLFHFSFMIPAVAFGFALGPVGRSSLSAVLAGVR